MEAIILAGGLGTRLRSVIGEMPKPMAEIAGRPFLEYQLDYLASQGISRVVLAIGYQAEVIKAHFGQQYKSITLAYSVEEELLGTGGAIKQSLSLCTADSVFVLNGDSFLQIDLKQMANCHSDSSLPATVAVKFMDDCERYGTVELDEHKRIVLFKEKKPYKNKFINSGIYCINSNIFAQQDYPSKFSFEKLYLEPQALKSQLNSYQTDGYFIDIGIPEDYRQAMQDFENANQS